jgi:hypothetical protein
MTLPTVTYIPIGRFKRRWFINEAEFSSKNTVKHVLKLRYWLEPDDIQDLISTAQPRESER